MMTLSGYLEQRGKKAKALTRIEAEAFGIPYPLQAGWPKRHGGMEITSEMVACVEAQAAADSQSSDRRIRRSARRATAAVTVPPPAAQSISPLVQPLAAPDSNVETSAVSGFVLRRARRFRKQAPWA